MSDKIEKDHILELSVSMANQFRASSIKEIASSAQIFADSLGMYSDDMLSNEANEAKRIFEKISHYLDLLLDLQQGKLHND